MSTLATLRKNERVQRTHDETFDRAFLTARILREKRAAALKASQVRITVLNEKRDLPI